MAGCHSPSASQSVSHHACGWNLIRSLFVTKFAFLKHWIQTIMFVSFGESNNKMEMFSNPPPPPPPPPHWSRPGVTDLWYRENLFTLMFSLYHYLTFPLCLPFTHTHKYQVHLGDQCKENGRFCPCISWIKIPVPKLLTQPLCPPPPPPTTTTVHTPLLLFSETDKNQCFWSWLPFCVLFMDSVMPVPPSSEWLCAYSGEGGSHAVHR